MLRTLLRCESGERLVLPAILLTTILVRDSAQPRARGARGLYRSRVGRREKHCDLCLLPYRNGRYKISRSVQSKGKAYRNPRCPAGPLRSPNILIFRGLRRIIRWRARFPRPVCRCTAGPRMGFLEGFPAVPERTLAPRIECLLYSPRARARLDAGARIRPEARLRQSVAEALRKPISEISLREDASGTVLAL